jgi:3-hydroxyisobutyrate dehydrogenase-like beta-hydroxyacid dehydrogenase
VPADAADGAEVLILDLPDSASYADSVFDLGGALETLPAGAFVLDLSPQLPSAARKACAAFARYGIEYSDGLLVNFMVRTRREQPLLLLGGSPVAQHAADRLLGYLGARKIRTGEVGSASHARLVLDDAYEMALRAMQDTEPGVGSIDDLEIDEHTVATVATILGGFDPRFSDAGMPPGEAAA